MGREKQKLKSSHSLFVRALITFPLIAFLIGNIIITQNYGSHKIWLWSYPYTALYYGLSPSQPLYFAYLIFILSIIAPFAWLQNNDKNKNRYGSAKFASRSTIKKMGLFKDKGVLLGNYKGQFLRYDAPLAELVLAPPGAGKTVGVAVPNIMTLNQSSLVVHDPKGELCRLTAGYRKTFSKTVIFNLAKKNSSVFNPFCKTALPEEQSEWQAYVDNIASIIYVENNNDDSYWLKEGRNMFRLFALYALYLKGETTFYEIYEISKSEDSVKKILNNIKRAVQTNASKRKDDTEDDEWDTEFSDDEEPEEYTEFEKKLITLTKHMLQASQSQNQMAGIIGSFNSGVAIFSEDSIRDATTGKNQLPMREMRKELYTTYIIVDEKDRARLRPIISLMLEAMAKDLISEEPVEGDLRITLILDEFTRLKGIDTIKTFPEICRGYNIAAIYIAQDYGQIGATFGKEMIEIFKSLSAYTVVFKQNNHNTAKMISEFIGEFTDDRETKSQNTANSHESTSISKEGLRLISAQDILNLPEEEIYIIATGYTKHPIHCKPALYYKEKTINYLVQEYKKTTYEEIMEASA